MRCQTVIECKFSKSLEQKYCGLKCSKLDRLRGGLIYEKTSQTTLKRHGYKRYFGSSEFRQKIFKKYGIRSILCHGPIRASFDKNSIAKKRHLTMKLRGFFKQKQSTQENICYQVLCELFGQLNIERHVQINNNDIDLYVKHLNVYIQVDGEYWHGLDRPLSKILKFQFLRDRVIHQTILRDERMNLFFKNSNKFLVRITDKEINKWQKEKNIRNKINERIMTKLNN